MTSFQNVDFSKLEIREDNPLFNVFQVIVLSVLLAVVCGMASRAVGLGWGVTMTLSWICGIAGTLGISFMLFAISDMLDRASTDTVTAEAGTDLNALVGEWDDDLAADCRDTVHRVLFGDRSAFRDQIAADLDRALPEFDRAQSDTPLSVAS